MDLPLRSAADLARRLGIPRQRLNPYVQRADVDPVHIEGRRKLYDADGQRRIVSEYHWGQMGDNYHGGPAWYAGHFEPCITEAGEWRSSTRIGCRETVPALPVLVGRAEGRWGGASFPTVCATPSERGSAAR